MHDTKTNWFIAGTIALVSVLVVGNARSAVAANHVVIITDLNGAHTEETDHGGATVVRDARNRIRLPSRRPRHRSVPPGRQPERNARAGDGRVWSADRHGRRPVERAPLRHSGRAAYDGSDPRRHHHYQLGPGDRAAAGERARPGVLHVVGAALAVRGYAEQPAFCQETANQ